MLEECELDCKFCVVHQYGVYILNASGIIILALVVYIYWKEIVALWRGKSKPIFPTSSDPQTQMAASPPNTVAGLQQNPIFAPPPVIAQPPVYTMPTNKDQPRPLSPGFHRVSTRRHRRPRTPAPLANKKFVKKTLTDPNQPASPDPFKLPTPDLRDIIADNESTGSNYYKQMMKGKKPVLSISQYLIKKHKKVRDDKKNNHHKKDNKK